MSKDQQSQAAEEMKKQQERVEKAVEAAALAQAEKEKAEQEVQDLRAQLIRLNQLRESETPESHDSDGDTPPARLNQLVQVFRLREEQRLRVSFREEAEALEEFSGLDEIQPVTSWTESIDEAAAKNGWSSRETFYAAKRVLSGAAKEWLAGEYDIKSWDTL